MKLISILPIIALCLVAIALLGIVACTAPQALGSGTAETENTQTPSNVVHRSLDLNAGAYDVVNEMANGVKDRSIGADCIILNIDGFELLSEDNIGVNVFLNDRTVNTESSKKSAHFIVSFFPGHAARDHGGESYNFSLDKTIEELGETLLADLQSGKLDVSLAAYPAFGNPETALNAAFTVQSMSIDVKCD